MSTLKEDIEHLIEVKRVLAFSLGNAHLANAIDRLERRLRAAVQILESMNANELPRNELLELHAQFTIGDTGVDITDLIVLQAPPQPKEPDSRQLKLVVDNDDPEDHGSPQ